MSESRLPDYLQQMQVAATDAHSFIDGVDKATFLRDKRTQHAVVMSLFVLGESATRILSAHPDFADSHPEVPWRSMRGMRNRIAHGYFDINLEVVWDTVQTAIPDLLQHLAELRQAADHSEADGTES